MALDTIPKQEGGKLKAVASGTLPSGQPVVVNADGTVSVVVETTNSGSETLGSQFALPTTNGQQGSFLGGTYDSVNQRAIITYRDANNSGYGTAVVGTVGGSSVTWGTPVVFDQRAQWTSAAFDSVNGKVVISYQDQDNSFYGTSIVGTVSGNSISFGTPVVFQSSETTYIDTTYDVSAGAIVVNYAESTGSGGRVVAGTVSGNSITFGSPVQFGGTGNYGRAVYHPEEQCTIIAWRDNSPSTRGSAIALTVSGTTITLGTKAYYLGVGQANQNDIAYDSDSKKIVIICRDEVSTTYGSSIVGTVSGTTLTFASPVTFQSGSVDWMGIEGWYTGGVVMTYDDQSSGNKIILKYGTISGTTISWGTGLEVYSGTGNNGYTGWSMATDVGRLVIAYNASSDGKYRVYNPTFSSSSTNLTSENYIGVSGGVVAVTDSASQVIGSETDFESGNRTDVTSVVYDSNSQKIVIAYKDDGNSGYGTAVVATVSGTTISFGTPVVFDTVAVARVESSFDSSSNKIVICYQDNTGNTGKAVVGTVSGTSISFGTPVTFNNQSTNHPSIAYDVNANKTVIVYRDPFNSSYGTAIVGTVSGTSISFGSEFVFESATTREPDVIYDPVAQKLIIAYGDEGNSYAATAVIGTVSGSSISFGTPVVFDSGGTDLIALVYDVEANATVVFYRPISESYSGAAIVGTVSGTSISFGTKQAYDSDEVREFAATYDSVAKRAVLGYRDTGNSEKGTIISVEVSGTTMTFSTPEVFSEDPRKFSAGYDSGQGKVVFSYFDEVQNSGRSCVVQVGYEEITRAEVADGGNATVDIVGTVSTNQLSLTAGQQYYVQTDGTIGETPADPSVLAGTAISATKMLVKT